MKSWGTIFPRSRWLLMNGIEAALLSNPLFKGGCQFLQIPKPVYPHQFRSWRNCLRVTYGHVLRRNLRRMMRTGWKEVEMTQTYQLGQQWAHSEVLGVVKLLLYHSCVPYHPSVCILVPRCRGRCNNKKEKMNGWIGWGRVETMQFF